MTQAKAGDTVTVTYEGYLENNDLFESSSEVGPLEFTIGQEQIFGGFESHMIGMAVGETKTFTLTPEEAHGPSQPELVHTLKRQALGDGTEISPGMILGMTMEKDGQPHKVPALVREVNDDQVTVDFNHPLAGQSLKYTVTMKSINEPPAS